MPCSPDRPASCREPLQGRHWHVGHQSARLRCAAPLESDRLRAQPDAELACTVPARGAAQLDPAVQRRLVEVVAAGESPARRRERGALPDGLTRREAEVLALIAQDRSNTEIAGDLFISEATVKTHINNLFAKANLRDRAQAVTYAFKHGLTA